MTAIQLKSVVVRFPAARGDLFEVLRIDEFTAEPGRLTVISGPSGSGKSTLIMVAAGLLKPQSGQVMFGGTDLVGLGESARDQLRRDSIGLVFQDFQLVPELSPLANVLLPASFGRHGRGLRGRAKMLLAEFGIPVDRSVTPLLSRGEQQRVAFARALLFDPPVILCDEPTASLDMAASEAIAAKLSALAKAGKTVVVVSHDRVVQGAADRLLRLDRGRLGPLSEEAQA